MRKGFSSATIKVSRQGVYKRCINALEQSAYCMQLGSMCPIILHRHEDWYCMEILDHPKQSPHLHDIRRLLERKVWNRPYKPPNNSWREKLCEWAHPLYIEPILRKLYPVNEPQCLIHGDPTLANAMIRNGSELVLIDPLPPKGKIPGYKEVDMGKMLQSYIGWERVLTGKGRKGRTDYKETLLKHDDELTVWRSEFWLFIHLLRIVPYAQERKDILQWISLTSGNLRKELGI